MRANNVVWHNSIVTREHRENLNCHRSAVLWFTGLSGAGKSTLAHAVEANLHLQGCRTIVLDGDNVRHGLCSDLDFSNDHRTENIRRVGEVAKLFVDSGTIVLTAFISPFREDRDRVRSLLPKQDFLEIFCDCSVEVCESRDVKGLYKKARAGDVANFTGISSPYESPLNPELIIPTAELSIDQAVDRILNLLISKRIIRAAAVQSLEY